MTQEERRVKHVERVKQWRKENRERWLENNRKLVKKYRDEQRGKPPRPYITLTKVEEILKAAGHCSFCGMLLDSEFHRLHPLVGCIKAAK